MDSFDNLDINGDGSLDKEELQPVITDMLGDIAGGGFKLSTQVGTSVSKMS